MNNIDKPKISVITVCYNSEKHLEECIRSVVEQSYENKEYIIIDGGSTDGTLAIIDKYRDKIDYFVSEPDRGISDAFNKGIKAASGEIIGICNSDDVLAENVLTKVAGAYDPEVEIYRLDEVTRNFKTMEEYRFTPTLVFNKWLIGCRPLHMGCYITKKAFEKYGGYDVNLKSSMDLDLLYRLTVKGAKYRYVPEVCGFFRKGGISGNRKIRNRERNIIIRKYGGTTWDIIVSMAYHLTYQFLKSVILLFGEDSATKLKSLYVNSLYVKRKEKLVSSHSGSPM